MQFLYILGFLASLSLFTPKKKDKKIEALEKDVQQLLDYVQQNKLPKEKEGLSRPFKRTPDSKNILYYIFKRPRKCLKD